MADAKKMKRSIAIALQYAEYGLPMVLDINMIDEAPSRGIEIDIDKLSGKMGIGVYPTVARDGIGVTNLIQGLSNNMKTLKKLVEYPDWIEQFLGIVSKLLNSDYISPRALGLLLLVRDKDIEQYIKKTYGHGMLAQLKELVDEYRKEESVDCNILLTNIYNNKAGQIVNEIQTVEPPIKNPFIVKFGDWCTQLSTGIPIAIAILWAMYLFMGSFGATFVVDTISSTLFEGFLMPLTEKLVKPIPSVFIRDMIIDPDFGILPTGVFLALGLVLPVLFCFFIAFGVLEDSGYLPRLSVLLDKVFQKMGLNGKGVIPLVMGFSCVTMAILTTRMLDTKKEKIIATFLLLLGMPCAPLLAVMFIILDKMPISATIAVFGIIFSQTLIAGYLANKILPGSRTPLFLEIPPMRLPKLWQIINMSAKKTYFFMKEAIPVFIIASFFVFLFERMGGLTIFERISEPIISGLMGLPEKSVQVFIKTIIRRENGATEIAHLSGIYTNLQLVVNLLVMTFLSPCINAIIILFKEHGSRAAIAILGTVLVYSLIIGSIVNHTCITLGITFT
ncbi:MAG: ferrous iron transporter B [Deltaproteobacteria bacterium]|nr:ferrous iron transporter B [Deltaproteobacteria bacterium]